MMKRIKYRQMILCSFDELREPNPSFLCSGSICFMMVPETIPTLKQLNLETPGGLRFLKMLFHKKWLEWEFRSDWWRTGPDTAWLLFWLPAGEILLLSIITFIVLYQVKSSSAIWLPVKGSGRMTLFGCENSCAESSLMMSSTPLPCDLKDD